jgi:hypothetical protein
MKMENKLISMRNIYLFSKYKPHAKHLMGLLNEKKLYSKFSKIEEDKADDKEESFEIDNELGCYEQR